MLRTVSPEDRYTNEKGWREGACRHHTGLEVVAVAGVGCSRRAPHKDDITSTGQKRQINTNNERHETKKYEMKEYKKHLEHVRSMYTNKSRNNVELIVVSRSPRMYNHRLVALVVQPKSKACRFKLVRSR